MVSKYRDVIEEKRANFRIANGLKTSNGFRGLLDVYQQKAEYESRLKVSRMKKELNIDDFLDQNDLPDYERNVRIVNKKGNDQERRTEKQTFNDFFDRSKRLLNLYYQDVYMKDRLSALTDDEILYTVKETPTNIKRAARRILDLIEKHNIKISPEGVLDFTNCTKPHIQERLTKDPYVKYAILHRDLGYGFTHLESSRKAKEELKRELFAIRAEDARIEEVETKEERELELKMQASQSTIDKQIGFISSGGFIKNKGDEEGGRKHANPADLIEGKQYRLDERDTLIETFPERLMRLEKKWLRERIANIEGGVEGAKDSEMREKYQVLTDKIRRVKLQLEKQAMDNAKDLLFEEHKRAREEGLWTETIPIERLLNYYSLPVDQRQPGLIEDTEYQNVRALVKRREVVEDLVPYHEVSYKSQMGIEDSEEFKQAADFIERVKEEANRLLLKGDRSTQKEQELLIDPHNLQSTRIQKTLARKASESRKKETMLQKIKQRVTFGVEKRKSLGILDPQKAEEEPIIESTPLRAKPGSRVKKALSTKDIAKETRKASRNAKAAKDTKDKK